MSWQHHRRPSTPQELLFLAGECVTRSDHVRAQGDVPTAEQFALLGIQLLDLAVAGGGLVSLLYRPPAPPLAPLPDWQVFGAVPRYSPDGLAAYHCRPGCPCWALPLEPSRQAAPVQVFDLDRLPEFFADEDLDDVVAAAVRAAWH